jgi:UDP-N-acetylmuramoyl-tripeptide--D-alanyl-D-alanine ligase
MNKFVTTEELHQLFINCEQKITTDTRKIEKGSMFFALKGENFNANSFARQAITAGCSFAIVDDEKISNRINILLVEDVLIALQQLAKYHRRQLKTKIIGITGSNGKTTNKELICAVLSKKYNTYATKGNLNNHIGVPLTLLALNEEHQMAIVEMGANHQGEIEMLCRLCEPDFGVITNIGKAHLEGFGGIEGVKKGKSELYIYINQNNGKIFINGNDEVLVNLSNDIEKIYYGDNEKFDVYGALVLNSEFVEFKWNIKNRSLENQPLLKTQMFGHYNFINLLCAACIGNYFGVEEQMINDALINYIPEMNRSQVKKTDRNTLILDAYNANPSSMSLAVDNFDKQAFQNKVVVLGDMLELGECSKQEHHKVASNISECNFKNVILVGMQFYELKDTFVNYAFYRNVSELISSLNTNKIGDSTILIKGSRGIQLEEIVEFL